MPRPSVIPLFAGKPSHFPVPLRLNSAVARSAGQGRSQIGALRGCLTGAGALAALHPRIGGRPVRLALLLLVALSSGTTIPACALAEDPAIARWSPRDPYAGHIAEAAQRFALPAAWVRAVMRAESGGDPKAVSPKGAIGLMQIMPATWADLRVRHGLGVDPYDPHDNIVAGAAYIRELFDRYGTPGWIAAYNAGPGRYEASLAGRPLPSETIAYIATVTPGFDAVGGSTKTVIAAAEPLSWTRAPLFIARPDHGASARSAPTAQPPGDGSTVVASVADVRDVSAIVPQSDGLFVARADTGQRP
nr:lytic transglycosylase domain-containing protein [Sphingomonas sanguinis]